LANVFRENVDTENNAAIEKNAGKHADPVGLKKIAKLWGTLIQQ